MGVSLCCPSVLLKWGGFAKEGERGDSGLMAHLFPVSSAFISFYCRGRKGLMLFVDLPAKPKK